MTTKSQLIAQCKTENPKMIQTVNGEEIELTGAEYEKACENWAEMKLAQAADELAISQAVIQKVALLERLGINADEASLLLG